jgi:hypothetical protein
VVTDLFHVDTVLLRRYYVLFVIEEQSRVADVLGATTNPNGPWVTQVARNFAADLEEAGRRLRFLIRDRDTKFTASFDEVFASIGVEAIRTPVRSPGANAVGQRQPRSGLRPGAVAAGHPAEAQDRAARRDHGGGRVFQGVSVRLPARKRTPHVSTWRALARLVDLDVTS